MGKKIIGVIAFAAIAVAAGWNYQQNRNDVKLSDLTLADVEALANVKSESLTLANASTSADKEVGCVNGTQNTRYCFLSNGRYKCDSYWIWNCVTEVNN